MAVARRASRGMLIAPASVKLDGVPDGSKSLTGQAQVFISFGDLDAGARDAQGEKIEFGRTPKSIISFSPMRMYSRHIRSYRARVEELLSRVRFPLLPSRKNRGSRAPERTKSDT
jgi:hypothetical protein